MTISPAYGRDYRSAPDAKTAWLTGKDFILRDITSRWNGKPCSIRDFPAGTTVTIRYAKLRKATVVSS